MTKITFSNDLMEKLHASVLITSKQKNMQGFKLAHALISYGEGAGIEYIPKSET